MGSLGDNRGGLARPTVRIGLVVAVLVAMIVILIVSAGDDDPTGDDADATTTDDGDAPVPTSIALPDGSMLDIEVFRGNGARTTIIAAPSRNADITSIRPVGERLAESRCADLIAFDASTVTTDPLEIYRTVLAAVVAGTFGPIPDRLGTLGASFTALPAWQAARDADAELAFSFSPSDLFPGVAPTDGPTTFLFVAEGDTGFLTQFEQWKAAGFNGVTVPGDAHGSALFVGTDDDVILNRIERALCF